MTCKCEYADECNGETAVFHPFQAGALCSTAPCKAPKQTLAAQRQWVGLTEDEAFACRGRDYFETYRAIDAKLKEKNMNLQLIETTVDLIEMGQSFRVTL